MSGSWATWEMAGFLWGSRNVDRRPETSQRAEPGWWEVAGAFPFQKRAPPTVLLERKARAQVCPGCWGSRRHTRPLAGKKPHPPKARLGTDGAGKAENRPARARQEQEQGPGIQPRACGSWSLWLPVPAQLKSFTPSFGNPDAGPVKRNQEVGGQRRGRGEGGGRAGWEPGGPSSRAAQEAEAVGGGDLPGLQIHYS